MIVGSNIQEKSFISTLLRATSPLCWWSATSRTRGSTASGSTTSRAGITATRYLIEKGHRRSPISPETCISRWHSDRIEGYKRALAEAGIDFSEEWVAAGDFLTHGGYRAMKELLPLGCTAVFVANDAMAYGALKAISEAGLKVPDDIAIIGFDDLEFSSSPTRP